MLKPRSSLPNTTITGNKMDDNISKISYNKSEPENSQANPGTNSTLSHSAINFSQTYDDPNLELIQVEKNSSSQQLSEGLGDQINPQISQKNMHHVQ